MRVIGKHAGHQDPERHNLLVRDRLRVVADTDNINHAYGLEHRQLMIRRKANEAVSGKKRNLNFFLAIFPLAHTFDRWQQGLDTLTQELVPHDLLIPRPRPKGVPTKIVGLVCLVHFVGLSCLVRRYLMSPEMIRPVLSACS